MPIRLALVAQLLLHFSVSSTDSPQYAPRFMKHALVTGAAGFIGSHVVDSLLTDGWRVTAIDNFDSFYATATKEQNVAVHLQHPAYTLLRADIRDQAALRPISQRYDVIVHLAAR